MQNEFYHRISLNVEKASSMPLTELEAFPSYFNLFMEYKEFQTLINAMQQQLHELKTKLQFASGENTRVLKALIHSLDSDIDEQKLRHKHIYSRLAEIDDAVRSHMLNSKRSKRINLHLTTGV